VQETSRSWPKDGRFPARPFSTLPLRPHLRRFLEPLGSGACDVHFHTPRLRGAEFWWWAHLPAAPRLTCDHRVLLAAGCSAHTDSFKTSFRAGEVSGGVIAETRVGFLPSAIRTWRSSTGIVTSIWQLQRVTTCPLLRLRWQGSLGPSRAVEARRIDGAPGGAFPLRFVITPLPAPVIAVVVVLKPIGAGAFFEASSTWLTGRGPRITRRKWLSTYL